MDERERDVGIGTITVPSNVDVYRVSYYNSYGMGMSLSKRKKENINKPRGKNYY